MTNPLPTRPSRAKTLDSPRGRLVYRRREAAALLREGRFDLAAELFALVAADARAQADTALEAGANIDRGVALHALWRLHDAVDGLARGFAIARRHRHQALEALALLHLGWIAAQVGEVRLARALLEHAWPRRQPDAIGADIALRLGSVLAELDEPESARTCLREALALSAARADKDLTRITADLELAWVDARTGATADGQAALIRQISVAIAARVPALHALGLQRLADLCMRSGQAARALQLCQQGLDLLGGPGPGRLDDLGLLRLQARAQAACGRWSDATATLERILALQAPSDDHFRLCQRLWESLHLAQPPATTAHPSAGLSTGAVTSTLTPIETELLRFLISGKTNRDIALQVGKATNTVRNQVAGILRKLGVSTRTAAVAVALANGLDAGTPTPSAGATSAAARGAAPRWGPPLHE